MREDAVREASKELAEIQDIFEKQTKGYFFISPREKFSYR